MTLEHEIPINFRTDQEQLDKLKQHKKTTGMPIADFIRRAIDEKLAREGKW